MQIETVEARPDGWRITLVGGTVAIVKSLADETPPAVALRTWLAAGNTPIFADNEFLSAAGLRAALLAKLAAHRYARETGGITVAGASIRTDRESQGLIAGARLLAEAQPAEPIDFKTPDGFVQIDSAAMIAISTAVGAHVRACFRREAEVAAVIAGLADSALGAFDVAAEWGNVP